MDSEADVFGGELGNRLVNVNDGHGGSLDKGVPVV
jgi:hypothetical protein